MSPVLNPAGAGAYSSAYPYNVLNPRFGAKGDGVTDDGPAIQAAINAAAAAVPSGGQFDVWLPPGYGFRIAEQMKPASGVRLVCYGGYIVPDFTHFGSTATTAPLFAWNPSSQSNYLTRWGIAGGTWLGTGAETTYQYLAAINYQKSGQFIHYKDMYVQNWATAVFGMENVQHSFVDDCELINVNSGIAGNTLNVINFIGDAHNGTILQLFNVGARRNTITGATTGASIAMVDNSNISHELAYVVAGNRCIGGTNNIGSVIPGNIDFESTTNGNTYSGIDVVDNYVWFQPANTPGNPMAGIYCVNAQYDRMRVMRNRVKSTWAAFNFYNSPLVCDNDVDAAHADLGTGNPQYRNNRRYGGPIKGTATLVAGTVTVNTPEVQAGDNIIVYPLTPAGTRGILQTGTIVAGTSFVINSIQPGTASTLQTSDTTKVGWIIEH